MLPPLSLPIPKIDPPQTITAESPPEEPPEPCVVSCGLHITPNMGLLTSYLMKKFLIGLTYWSIPNVLQTGCRSSNRSGN